MISLLLALFSPETFAQAQKEVIIIEKLIDANGNVISQNVKRQSGNFTEDELTKIIEESQNSDLTKNHFFPLFDNKSFFDQIERRDSKKPSIGIYLSFENSRSIIIDVVPGSGALEADIRKGDELISINGLVVSSIEEIQDIIKDNKIGDVVKIRVYRDGSELDKMVTLKSTSTSSPNLQFPENLNFRQFFDSPKDGNFFKLDSLFDFDNLFREFGQSRNNNLVPKFETSKEDKAQLGVFVDDINGVEITEVIPGSAAEKAGLKIHDKILKIDQNILTSFSELSMIIGQKKRGDKISIEAIRNNKNIVIEVTLD